MNALRTAVSGKRNRFKEDGWDLDLTYITDRIIAMGFPASGVEATYRNSIDNVSSFLRERHGLNYLVFNLSERKYDYTKFNNQVLEYGFPDHHAPSLDTAWKVCHSMHAWLNLDERNVVVVHCKAGKGRTGVVVACYMMLSGLYNSPDLSPRRSARLALEHFLHMRGEGVNYPSQKRYVEYFAELVVASGKHHPSRNKEVPIDPASPIRRQQQWSHTALRYWLFLGGLTADGTGSAARLQRAEAAEGGAGAAAARGQATDAATDSGAGGGVGGGAGGGAGASAGSSAPSATTSAAVAGDDELSGAGQTDDPNDWVHVHLRGYAEGAGPAYLRSAMSVVHGMPKLPLPPPKHFKLHRIIMSETPIVPGGFCPIIQVWTAPVQHQANELVYSTVWDNPTPATYGQGSGAIVMQFKKCIIRGDVLIRCLQHSDGKEIFFLSFHTSFVTDDQLTGVWRLEKSDIDMESRSKNEGRIPDSFFLDMIFDATGLADTPAVTRVASEPAGRTQSLPTATDDGRGAATGSRAAAVAAVAANGGGGGAAAVATATSGRAQRSQSAGAASDATMTPAAALAAALTASHHDPSRKVAAPVLAVKPDLSQPATSETPAQASERFIQMGWLTKQGGFIRNWKRRWFVLRKEQLQYFKSESAVKAQGVIPISQAHGVAQCKPSECQGRRHCFKLKCDKRTFYLQAESQDDLEAWVMSLAIAIGAAQAPVKLAPRGAPASAPASGGASAAASSSSVAAAAPPPPPRATAAEVASLRARLVEFYKEHNPEKCTDEHLDKVSKAFAGRESLLWERLLVKYGIEDAML